MEDEEPHGGFLGGMGGIQTMGLLNALRTGDAMFDMILAMCFPFVISFFMEGLKEGAAQFRKWLYSRRGSTLHERTIVHRSQGGGYYDETTSNEDTQNSVLIKAIQLYINSQLNLVLTHAHVDLASTEDKIASLGRSGDRYYNDSCREDDDDESKTVVGALSKYPVVLRPPQKEWHNLGRYGPDDSKEEREIVRLMISSYQEDGASEKVKRDVVEYQLQSVSYRAIDAFVNKAYEWYVNELRKLEDDSRYFYELVAEDAKKSDDDFGGSGSKSGQKYKRYALSDEKTFKSLFFPEKEGLLKIIEHFQERSGRYSIAGYPHKLGLLLHGPPGSGKSSLIKALAQYTGRSIVNVPLARIKTNAELMSIFFDHKKYVDGQSVPVKLGFKDVIYVMEDVDAASKIVHRRDGKKTAAFVQTDQLDLPLPKPLFHMLLESNEEDCKELVEKLLEESEKLKHEATKSFLIKGVARRMASLPGLRVVGDAQDNPVLEKIGSDALETASKMLEDRRTVEEFLAGQSRIILNMLEHGTVVDDEFVDELLGLSPFRNMAIPKMARNVSYSKYDDSRNVQSRVESVGTNTTTKAETAKGKESEDSKEPGVSTGISSSVWKADIDALNLTGLLNVLDGVVDSPGRIVIMTTNHVDHLDPALIRPGRIDKRLLLGYMAPNEIILMLEHYFQLKLTKAQRKRVEIAITGKESGDAHGRLADDAHVSGMTSRPHVNLTPAQVEQMSAEHDDIEDMILALEEKGRPKGPQRSQQYGSVSKSDLFFDGL